jgi:peptidoglycan/LPS O-acetylase OafA/YrhL
VPVSAFQTGLNDNPAVTGIQSASARGMRAADGHRRIADIELLRGLAVLFVIVQHAHGNLISWPHPSADIFYGYFQFDWGVDLFFAISGFVIARGLIPMLAQCRTAVEFANATLSFWVRRGWRLLPSAWLWLALILLASVGFNRSGLFGSFQANLEATVADLLDVANFRFAAAFGHFGYGASFPYWSLSLEEQFYLIFPVLIFAARQWLPAVLGLGVLAQLFIVRTPVLMVVRTDALMLGVLIALAGRTEIYRLFAPRFLARSRCARGAVLALPVLAMATIAGSAGRVVWFPVGLIALVSAGLVFIASFDGDYLMRDGWAKRALLWVGSRSYALYLVHMPVMFGMREVWLRLDVRPAHGHGWALVLLALGLMGVLAELNFRLVETPLRRHGARIADAILARHPPARIENEPALNVLHIAP